MTLRRHLLVATAASLATPALLRAQTHHGHHGGQFERLNQPGRIDLPEVHAQQAVSDSPAPRAARAGAWRPRAPLPIPRTEMAWAAAYRNRVHLVGGYAEQRVDKPYHHAYDPATDRWEVLAQLPRGANHVGVATLGEHLYAFGGFIEQNRTPHDEAFRFDGTRWAGIRRLPEACGAMACVALGPRVHLIGGAIGSDWRRSIDWHLVYDPASDRYERRQPLPTARDHIGIVVVGSSIHVIGGRVDSFHTNSSLHHSYDAQADRWVSHAPMITPRHGMGAVVIGDEIIVAGGGPQMGGGVKSAINESFTLA